jgi:ABC-type branched-subunit amino acid transport system ATPase component
MALLSVEGVSYAYGALPVLFGVSFHVDEGEFLALLGTNGAGKSTVLRLVCGLARPAAGSVVFDGERIDGSPAGVNATRGLVLMPGGRAIFPDLTVDENLEIGSFLLRRSPAVRRARIRASYEAFPDLAQRRRTVARRLSGGQQQQLALAKATLLRPRLLCIDELSLGLAPIAVERLLESLAALREEGTSMILVEQSLNVAAAVASRCVFLEKGEVRFEGATEQLLERDDIARAVFFGADAKVGLARTAR